MTIYWNLGFVRELGKRGIKIREVYYNGAGVPIAYSKTDFLTILRFFMDLLRTRKQILTYPDDFLNGRGQNGKQDKD